MSNLNLKNITLCAITSIKIKETVFALKQSMRNIQYADVLLFTNENINLDEDGIKVIKIEKLNYDEYSHFVLYKLKDYIKSDFVLVVQHDGYVLRPQRWKNEFFKYDYIGAPWKKNIHFTEQRRNIRVGNGGFSLRSKKILNLPSELNIPFTDHGSGFLHEDGLLCIHWREILEKNDALFAPVEVASYFSRERWCSDSKLFTFGFHNNRKNILRFMYKKIISIF